MYIVDFPWYDFENVEPHLNKFWSVFRQKLLDAGFEEHLLPKNPCREIHFSEQWSAPNLLISQACGFDVVTTYKDQLQIIAAPSYTIDGLKKGNYFSYLVTSEDSPALDLSYFMGKKLAINSHHSHSGMNIFRCVLKSEMENFNFAENLIISGAHIRSLQLIKQKKADLAAIDGVTYHLLEKHDPEKLKGTKVIRKTPAVTSCPYITRKNIPEHELNLIKHALFETFADPLLAPTLQNLLLEGVSEVSLADYKSIEQMNLKYGS